MSLELVPLCTLTFTLGPPTMIPNCPAGTRVIVEVGDGKVEGERLRGKQKGVAAADWATVGPEGTGTVDVRVVFETHDGAAVFVQYNGRLDVSKGTGGAPVYAAPRFETGDERYAWLNKVQGASKGIIEGTTLTYEVYELR